MCKWGTGREITIERRLTVDACIADEIVRLNKMGVYTTGCCCGHGKGPATANILPSAQDRARECGYDVTLNDGGDPYIEIRAAVDGAGSSRPPLWVDDSEERR